MNRHRIHGGIACPIGPTGATAVAEPGVPGLVSTVMPIFNPRTSEVAAAVESVLSQTWSEWELLLLDESTEAKVQDLLLAYTERDSRVKYYSIRDGRGYVACLNAGVAMARGEFIARMDADDIAYPRRFEKQLRFLQSHPEVGVVGSAVMKIDSDGRAMGLRRFPLESAAIRQHMGLWNAMEHPTVVVRRSAFAAAGSYDGSVDVEDYELWRRFLRAGIVMANLPEPLLQYRIPTSNEGFRRGRHWRSNLVVKCRYFDWRHPVVCLCGVVVTTAMWLAPAGLQAWAHGLVRHIKFHDVEDS